MQPLTKLLGADSPVKVSNPTQKHEQTVKPRHSPNHWLIIYHLIARISYYSGIKRVGDGGMFISPVLLQGRLGSFTPNPVSSRVCFTLERAERHYSNGDKVGWQSLSPRRYVLLQNLNISPRSRRINKKINRRQAEEGEILALLHPPEDNKNNAFICCRGLHSAPSIDVAFMAVVFLIGILGQPFELFNRAPIPWVEGEKEICLCLRACVFVLLGVSAMPHSLLSLLWRSLRLNLSQVRLLF